MANNPVSQGGKEVLAVDIDEVMFPFVQEFSIWHNTEYGTELSLLDFHSYEFENVLGTDIPETVHRVHSFLGQRHGHISVTPIDEAVNSMQRLNERFYTKPLTARHPSFRDMTKEYLHEYFEGLFDDVILIGHAATMGSIRTKAEVCAEIGARGLLDDSVVHTTGCAEAGLDAILFGDYPWNQEENLHPGIVRCETWSKVLAYYDLE